MKILVIMSPYNMPEVRSVMPDYLYFFINYGLEGFLVITAGNSSK